MLRDTPFCHLPESLMIDMEKKLVDTASKPGTDAAKTASKRVVQKTAEASGDLIGNKIPDKITSAGKLKKDHKTKKAEKIYIPPEKGQ